MILFRKMKDGGPNSPVEGYFLIESKRLFSVALLKFNKGRREEFHNHAFNAFTWFLFGDLEEEVLDLEQLVSRPYKRSIFPKITSKLMMHRVLAHKTSWCLTIRGPWSKYWEEVNIKDKTITTLGHGRTVQKKEKI